jgi:hypothetical protein
MTSDPVKRGFGCGAHCGSETDEYPMNRTNREMHHCQVVILAAQPSSSQWVYFLIQAAWVDLLAFLNAGRPYDHPLLASTPDMAKAFFNHLCVTCRAGWPEFKKKKNE